MSDTTSHLLLPYILASQGQKHVTHNEALRQLDAIVQLSVLDRDQTSPPTSPAGGDRHLVALGATGLWSGWDLNIAARIDGVWMRLLPRPGWLAWVAAESAVVVWTGSAWDPISLPISIDPASGRVELPEPLIMALLPATPEPPPPGHLALYARERAGMRGFEVQRPSGRSVPLQSNFGINRIAIWAPSSGSTVTTNGMPRTAVGTVTTPTLATTTLSSSMRRWRVTSAATVDAVAEERSAAWVCWRGNAEGLGGWSYVNRFLMTTLQPTGMGFFGLYGSTSALATTLTLATVVNCVGLGFQRGTHTNWQLVHNDGSGAPTLTDLGANFPVASTTNVLSLHITAAPNGSDIGIRVVEEVSGNVVEFTITTDMPAATQLLSPRNYMNTGATAAAVAYDCSGIYIETDY